jgi:hypothetical protein
MLLQNGFRNSRGQRSWSGLRIRPRTHGGYEGCGGRRLIAERLVWAVRVVVPTPTFLDNPSFREGVEYLPVQYLITKPGLEGFNQAILPSAHCIALRPRIHNLE